MFSIAELLATNPASFDPRGLWTEGEVFANHPRVRLARLEGRRVTVHHHGDSVPSGIGVLAADRGLATAVGLRLASQGLHVMDYVEGEPLDSLAPEPELIEPLLRAMVHLWRRPSDCLPEAGRERPIIGPVTRGQYVGMPDAVLVSANEHESAVVDALRRLGERGPGRALIHGDLKADNVVRVDGGEVRFIDWECCGVGHPEDDVASLLASMCVYGIGRAVRRSLGPDGHRRLAEHVAHELERVRRFGKGLLQQLRRVAPGISVEQIGAAFLVSSFCRMQGALFVPSSEAVRLTVSAFVTRSMQRGPEAVHAWLLDDDSLAKGATQ